MLFVVKLYLFLCWLILKSIRDILKVVCMEWIRFRKVNYSDQDYCSFMHSQR